MIAEVSNPAIVNFFANHPDNNSGPLLDLTGAMGPKTAYFLGKHGGFAFEWTAPGTYEVHAMVVKAGRGRWALDALETALRAMQGRAERFWARIEPDRPEIALFARLAGFRDCGANVLAPWRIYERRM